MRADKCWVIILSCDILIHQKRKILMPLMGAWHILKQRKSLRPEIDVGGLVGLAGRKLIFYETRMAALKFNLREYLWVGRERGGNCVRYIFLFLIKFLFFSPMLLNWNVPSSNKRCCLSMATPQGLWDFTSPTRIKLMVPRRGSTET